MQVYFTNKKYNFQLRYIRRSIMKQKYTLSIADMEINVVTDQSPESVEHIVGILDRKMREIALKSKRCTKGEAAVLCALDFCADKIRLKEEREAIDEEIEDLNTKIEHLTEKLELVSKNADRLEKEKIRLEKENTNLRNALDNAKYGSIHNEEPEVAEETVEEAVEEAVVEAVEEIRAVEEPEEKQETPISKNKKGIVGKSRVGAMFDLLTFTDI